MGKKHMIERGIFVIQYVYMTWFKEQNKGRKLQLVIVI